MVAKNRKVFFDTNILVYQFDQSAPLKQKQAIKLIEENVRNEQAVISSQVVQEFMNVALKKFTSVLTISELELVVSQLLMPLCSHFPNPGFYERMLKLYSGNSLSFYDALIIQAAMDLNCVTIYSEDLQDGQRFGTLTVKNPFDS